MKNIKLFTLFALMLMVGGVTMQGQEYNSNNTKTPALTQYDYK